MLPARAFHNWWPSDTPASSGLPLYCAIHHNQNDIYDGTAHMYPVQERLHWPQASDAAMQLLQEGMAHLYVPVDHSDYPGRLTLM